MYGKTETDKEARACHNLVLILSFSLTSPTLQKIFTQNRGTPKDQDTQYGFTGLQRRLHRTAVGDAGIRAPRSTNEGIWPVAKLATCLCREFVWRSRKIMSYTCMKSLN